MPHAGGTLGKYVVHNFICLCFMVEGSYVIIYTQDHNSSPERGRLRITLCRQQEDMKELLPIHHHHHHHLKHRVRSIICTELHSPIECWLKKFLWSVGWSEDNDAASFDDFTRLFATPAQDDDPSLHTPVALLRHPTRDVRPLNLHSYTTYHVHAQRKRGRNGRGG